MNDPTPDQLGPDILANLYAIAGNNPGIHAAIMVAEAQAQSAYWKKQALNGQSDLPKSAEGTE